MMESEMSVFSNDLPSDPSELRRRLYLGEVFVIPGSSATLRLVERVERLITEAFGSIDPRRASEQLGNDAFFDRVSPLRRQIYSQPDFHALVGDVITERGFAVEDTGFNPARLRMVSPYGHEIPSAAPLYYGHRDTWYTNPQTILTWWTALEDVDASNSFAFYPEFFNRPVANDSEVFDYAEWVETDDKKLIGWQDRETGLTADYPQLLEEPHGRQEPLVCNRGDLLIFSGQHLHRTHAQTTSKTRFSLDFRTVTYSDEGAGRGPANVDNRSTGSWKAKFTDVIDVIDAA